MRWLLPYSLLAVLIAPIPSAAQPVASASNESAGPAFPVTISLEVDATDTTRGIFRVTQRIPVTTGHLVLRYPKWIPGYHGPRGPVDQVAGLLIDAGGKPLTWRRDPVDMYAIHVDVPQGVDVISVCFDYVSPTKSDHGRIIATPEIINLQWNLVAFYPAGWRVSELPVAARVRLPEGWNYGTALEADTVAAASHDQPGPREASALITFKPVSFETLIDSPLFAGRYSRKFDLGHSVWLNVFADTPEELAASPEQLQMHRALVSQALKLFGTQAFDRYDFLFATSDRLSPIGIEHHRSSENGVKAGYFRKWDEFVTRRSILPHELVHSWNGKHRRGADLATPDFSTPMQNSLLWVYEGQTQFWTYVLQTRSGLVSKADTLGAIAMMTAQEMTQPGRRWRPLVDTTADPIMTGRRPQPWSSWQRSEDFYNEGVLIWFDVNAKLRALTKNRRSMDDFASAFFGGTDGDWSVRTYRFEDVVATLNMITPFDWDSFLRTRIDDVRPEAPLGWLQESGYRLIWKDEPTAFWKASEKARKIDDFSYSLGLVVNADKELAQVIWEGPAFAAGLTVGTKLIAVDGRAYDADVLKQRIRMAKTSNAPIQLLVQRADRFETVSISWQEGLRYPWLEPTGKAGTLDAIMKPR